MNEKWKCRAVVSFNVDGGARRVVMSGVFELPFMPYDKLDLGWDVDGGEGLIGVYAESTSYNMTTKTWHLACADQDDLAEGIERTIELFEGIGFIITFDTNEQ